MSGKEKSRNLNWPTAVARIVGALTVLGFWAVVAQCTCRGCIW